MSTIKNGYLVSPPKAKGISWLPTGNISGVSYSRPGNANSRGSTHNPSAVINQLKAKQSLVDKIIGRGYNPLSVNATTRTFFGGKKTRRRRSKSRKTKRRM